MDEILIEDKKYVSSKRAAKITGYAKDYIGQLCREGRVSARLVGRSWYVLESAIQDHRFGDQKTEQEREASAPPVPAPTPVAEFPRYEASTAEILPSVNRLRATEPEENTVEEASEPLQDSWKTWFDHMAIEPQLPEEKEEKKEQEPEPIEEVKEEEIPVPIRAIYHPQYQLPPEELLPRHIAVKPAIVVQEEAPIQAPIQKRERGVVVRAVQMAGAFVAISITILATLGSGYFDTYISGSQVGLMAGVSLYNR